MEVTKQKKWEDSQQSKTPVLYILHWEPRPNSTVSSKSQRINVVMIVVLHDPAIW